MAGLKKFLYITADGFHAEQAASDELALGALTMGGDISMTPPTTYKVTGLGDGANAEDAIAYGQAAASLSGLSIYDADIVMDGNSITGLGAPENAGDAANKKYVDDLVTAGRTWREILLHPEQLDTTAGILSAGLLFMDDQPESGDLTVLTNGVTTRTYGCVAGGNVQDAIGGTTAITMANLVAAIEGDTSSAWNAYLVEGDLSTLGDNVIVIVEKSSASGLTKLYGTWHTPAHAKILNFTGLKDYNLNTLTNMPGPSAPADANFGFHRIVASLNAGELHEVRSNDTLYTWDENEPEWAVILGPASLPDATSASGGGTKGKLGVDSDLGLEVTSGILGIDLASSGGLEFDGSGDLQVHVHATNPGLDIDGSNGLRVSWDGAHGIIVGTSGLELEIDDTPDTLDVDGDGLKVTGVPAEFKLGGSAVGATVSAANLTELTNGSETALHTHAGFSSAERTELEYTAGTDGVAIGDPVYLTADGDTVEKADASDSALSWVLGVAKSTEDEDDPVDVVMGGVAKAIFSGKAAGQKYYLGDGGGLATSIPTGAMRVIFIGVAINATDLLVAIRDFGLKAA